MKFKGPKLPLVTRLQMMARRSKILFVESGVPLGTPLKSCRIQQEEIPHTSAMTLEGVQDILHHSLFKNANEL